MGLRSRLSGAVSRRGRPLGGRLGFVPARASVGAVLLLPGAITAFMSFRAGGFFPDTPALVAVALLLVLVAHVTLADAPFAGLSPALVAAAAALGLFALWTLISQSWSDAPARALIEFDRAFLYLLALVAFGALGRTAERLRWIVRGVALAIVAVCTVGLITRVAPDVWPIAPNLANHRLSYPLTYWNALGLLAALGTLLAIYLTTSEREPWWARIAGSASLPILASALLFTFSRGAIAIGIVGVVVYLLVARPRAVTGLLAAAPTTAIAVVAAYRADLLAGSTPTSAAATAQGHDVALVVALCVLGAAAGRALLLRADARLTRLRLPAPLRRPTAAALGAGGAVVIGVAAAVALGAPDDVRRQYDRFVHGNVVRTEGDLRQRLTDPGNNGRLAMWRVALAGFREDRLQGEGAGTYATRWDQHRGPRNQFEVTDGHSLYLEVLDELGLPGLAFLALALLLVLGGFAARARGPDRTLYGVLTAAGTTWALHAGIDWDWEMPALTLWLFAAGGMALAAPAAPAGRPPPGLGLPRLARVVIGLACLVLAVTPARIALSEWNLQDARRAFARGDCTEAIDKAVAAASHVRSRPEPYEIVGFCDVRTGFPRLGVDAMEQAVDRDPRNWELHYGLALVRGAARLDPRAAARAAAELNPREPLTIEAVRLFDTSDVDKWERRARHAPLPK
jgi:O-antigen ligase